MKKAAIIIVVLLVAAAGGLAASFLIYQDETQSGLELEDVVPPDPLYWLEVRDAGGLYARMKGTQSWKDLQASPMLAELRKSPQWTASMESVQAVSEKVDFAASEENLMKFLGDEVAGAFYVGEDGEQQFVAVSRIDTEALARDLLTGDADWRELQAEMDDRLVQAGCEVTAVDVGEYKLATAKKDDTTVHITLMEDLLVVSNDEALARKSIALRVAEGAGSLGADPNFKSDMANRPEDAAATDWINVAQIRGQRKRIAKSATKATGKQGGPQVDEFVERALSGMEAPSVARTLRLPGGDLYELTWEYSKSDDELFVDDTRPDLRDIVSDDVMMYMELTSLRRVQLAWEGSNVAKALENSWFSKKLDEAMKAPDKALSMMDLDHLTRMPGADPTAALDDEFARTFAWSLTKRSLASTFGNGFAIGGGMSEDGEPEFVAALRLDTDGRMMEMMARGLVASTTEAGMTAHDHDGRSIVGRADPGGSGVWWSAVGDVLIVGSDLDRTKAAMDRAVGGGAGAVSSAFADLGLSDDPEVFMSVFINMPAITGTMKQMGGVGDAEMDLMTGRFGYGVYGNMGFQASVPDDFGHIQVSAAVELAATDETSMLDIYRNAPAVRPTTLDAFPEATFFYAAANVDFATVATVMREMMGELEAPEAWDEGEQAVEQVCGVGLTALLEALGPEFAMGGVLATEPVSEQIPAIPGIVFSLGTRDADVAKQALDGFVEWFKAEMEPPAGADGPRIGRAVVDGREIYRFEMPDVPFAAAFGLVDGTLYLVSDEALLTDIIAVRGGGAASIAMSKLQSRILATGVSMDSHAISRFDWDTTMDQLAAYSPQLAEMYSMLDDIPFPDYPEDGDDEEWTRRMTAYQEARVAAAKESESEIREAIDSMRFVDFVISTQTFGREVSTGTLILAFK